MPPRLRKLIGTLILIALVVVYALVATTVAVARLQDSSWVVHLGFFFISGLLWVLPAMFIVSWMAKGSRRKA
jgi:ABC-type multidrug transport system permease subunit